MIVIIISGAGTGWEKAEIPTQLPLINLHL